MLLPLGFLELFRHIIKDVCINRNAGIPGITLSLIFIIIEMLDLDHTNKYKDKD